MVRWAAGSSLGADSRADPRGGRDRGTLATTAAAGGSGRLQAEVDSGARAAPPPAWPSSSGGAAPAGVVETEASSLTRNRRRRTRHRARRPSRPGAAVRRVARRVDVPADVARANPFTPPPAGPAATLALRTSTVPAKPRWLLSIPDAISQLEQLDRPLLTRRDVERLFGVGKVRAAALMKTFGAELVGNQRTLPRTRLLQQLK